MKRRPQQFPTEDSGRAPPSADADGVLQIKVWLIGISPMVWRRVLVPAAFTLRELHGVIQVAMGWEGFHLSNPAFVPCATAPRSCRLRRANQ
jgi:hypothetical protein